MSIRLVVALAMILTGPMGVACASEASPSASVDTNRPAIKQLLANAPCRAIQRYESEFRRPDQKPFETPQADWTQADYDALHDRLQACMNDWTRVHAADLYLANVDARLRSYQQDEMQRLQRAQQQKDQENAARQRIEQQKVAQQKQLQEILARQKAARAAEDVRQKQHEIDNARAATRIDEQIASLEGFSEEIDRLPDTPASKKRVAQIDDSAVEFNNVASSLIGFQIAPDRLQKFRALTTLVFQKVSQKNKQIAAAEIDLNRVAFNKLTDAAVSAHSRQIAGLGFSAGYLHATIVLEPGRPYIPLQSYIGLLLNRPDITVTKKSFGRDTGLGIKVPNKETIFVVFRMDGGELFPTEIVVGDRSYPVITEVDRTQAATLLRSAIGGEEIQDP